MTDVTEPAMLPGLKMLKVFGFGCVIRTGELGLGAKSLNRLIIMRVRLRPVGLIVVVVDVVVVGGMNGGKVGNGANVDGKLANVGGVGGKGGNVGGTGTKVDTIGGAEGNVRIVEGI